MAWSSEAVRTPSETVQMPAGNTALERSAAKRSVHCGSCAAAAGAAGSLAWRQARDIPRVRPKATIMMRGFLRIVRAPFSRLRPHYFIRFTTPFAREKKPGTRTRDPCPLHTRSPNESRGHVPGGHVPVRGLAIKTPLGYPL